MLMVKLPHLVFGFWTLVVVIISTSEAQPSLDEDLLLGKETAGTNNELEENADNR